MMNVQSISIFHLPQDTYEYVLSSAGTFSKYLLLLYFLFSPARRLLRRLLPAVSPACRRLHIDAPRVRHALHQISSGVNSVRATGFCGQRFLLLMLLPGHEGRRALDDSSTGLHCRQGPRQGHGHLQLTHRAVFPPEHTRASLKIAHWLRHLHLLLTGRRSDPRS